MIKKILLVLTISLALAGCSKGDYRDYYITDGSAYECVILENNVSSYLIKYEKDGESKIEQVFKSQVHRLEASQLNNE